MTHQQAEKVANIVIGLAVVGAAYAVLRIPTVRRTAWQIARTAMGAAGPWLIAEARQAWDRSRIEQRPRREVRERALIDVEAFLPSDVEGPGLSAVTRSASDSVGQPHAI